MGHRRELAAAVARPGTGGELQPAVIAIAGVDGPVSTGLTTRHLIPFGVGRRLGLCGHADAAAGDDDAGDGDLGDADGRVCWLAVASGHWCVPLCNAPARSAVGFGRERLPGRGVSYNATGFTPRRRAPSPISVDRLGPPPPSGGVRGSPRSTGWSSAREAGRACLDQAAGLRKRYRLAPDASPFRQSGVFRAGTRGSNAKPPAFQLLKRLRDEPVAAP